MFSNIWFPFCWLRIEISRVNSLSLNLKPSGLTRLSSQPINVVLQLELDGHCQRVVGETVVIFSQKTTMMQHGAQTRKRDTCYSARLTSEPYIDSYQSSFLFLFLFLLTTTYHKSTIYNKAQPCADLQICNGASRSPIAKTSLCPLRQPQGCASPLSPLQTIS